MVRQARSSGGTFNSAAGRNKTKRPRPRQRQRRAEWLEFAITADILQALKVRVVITAPARGCAHKVLAMKQVNEDSLWKAVLDGKAARVKAIIGLLDRRRDKQLIDQALWYAVLHGNAAVVKALLAAGGDADSVNSTGTLLMNAAWDGHLDVVQALVAGGAAVDRKSEGRTALEAALETNHVEVANYLRKVGANWASPTLLHACQHGDLERMKEAIAAGAKIDRRYGDFKETPLMRASGNGQVHVVKYLLLHGAKANTRVDGKTALWNAAATGRSVEVIDALIEAGAKVNDPCDGCTVLMTAAQFGCLPVVKRLVELGADVTAIDRKTERGVMDYARDGKNRDVISYLRAVSATSARDPAREVARALAREFGGRPISGCHGFVLNSRLSGFKCEFHHIGRSSGSVEISDLEYIDTEFGDAENAELIIGQRPEVRRGRFRKLNAAEQILGISVYRSVAQGTISADSASKFCSRHRRAFRRLSLSAAEELWLGASFIQYTWAESEFRRILARLRAFGALVRGIARPSRPESIRVWDD
jgi:ankyrin repeat protein